MRIVRSTIDDETIAPCSVNYLGEIPENYYFINQHARRTPLGIYNVSFQKLSIDFNELLDQYFSSKDFIRRNIDNIQSEGEYYIGLLKAQEKLIYSLQAYIDDCYAILASLINPANVPANIAKINFADRWLAALKFPTLNQFKKAISAYRDNYLSHLVNGLKHRKNRLRGIFFYNATEVRFGYYLEEQDTNGIPGPSFNLHEDGNSAFSFTKDIIFNLYYIYNISECLTEAVRGALRYYYSLSLNHRVVE